MGMFCGGHPQKPGVVQDTVQNCRVPGIFKFQKNIHNGFCRQAGHRGAPDMADTEYPNPSRRHPRQQLLCLLAVPLGIGGVCSLRMIGNNSQSSCKVRSDNGFIVSFLPSAFGENSPLRPLTVFRKTEGALPPSPSARAYYVRPSTVMHSITCPIFSWMTKSALASKGVADRLINTR